MVVLWFAFGKASRGSPLCGLKAQPAWHPTAQACGDLAASALPKTSASLACFGDPNSSNKTSTKVLLNPDKVAEKLEIWWKMTKNMKFIEKCARIICKFQNKFVTL